MKAPQMIYIALIALGVGIDLARHGEPKSGTHSAWISLVDAALTIWLLKWGGFF